MGNSYFQKLRQFRRDVWLYLSTWALIGFAYSGLFLVLFNLYLLRLGYGPEFIGVVNGVGLIALGLFSLPAGALGKRWGSRRMMIAGMGLMTVGFGALPLAEYVPVSWQAGWLVATWSLASFSAPLFTVNGAPFLMGVTGPKERDYAFSMQLAFFSLAGFAGGLIAGFLPGFLSGILAAPLNQPAPFRYSLFLAGALIFVGLLMTLATRDGSVEHEQGRASEAAGPIPLALIGIMGIVMFLRTAGEWAPNGFFNVYLDAELHASTALIGSLVAVTRLMSGAAALSMPAFVNRWGKERVIGWGTIGVAISLLPLALLPHWGAAEIGFIGAMALTTMVTAAYFVYGQEIVSPGWQAVMSGAIWMGSGVGGSFILIIGGRIIATYSYSSYFLMAAGLTAAGGLFFWSYFRMPRGEYARHPAHEPAG
jgi:MFS family permease